MALYKYKATYPGKTLEEVIIEADSEADALTRLQHRGMIPIKFLGETDSEQRRVWKRAGLNIYEFTDRLAPLLEANIQLERALAIIEEGTEEKGGRNVVRDLRRGLHEGKRFSELVKGQGGCFPPLYAGLIETGEETGCLPEVVSELRRFINESRDLKEFIITSSIYPIIVIGVTFVVIILLFTVFIPRFAGIFMEMGRSLPLLTRLMLHTGNLFTSLWWIWPLLTIGAVWFSLEVKRSFTLRRWSDKTLLNLPLLGGIVQSVQISRFIRTLSIMIKNHVHLLSAVKIATKVILNTKIVETLSGAETELRSGGKLSAVLAKSRYIPVAATAMLRISEESGNVGDMLERVADELERKIRLKIKRLLALMEPVIILFLAVIILLVVLSIFLAIMEMNAI